MPRPLDVEGRRAEITRAAVSLLARDGIKGLTMKALAAEIGGSTTPITQIFPRKSDLLEGILDSFEHSSAKMLDRLDEAADPMASLRAFLAWCMPATDDEAEEERLRLAMLD